MSVNAEHDRKILSRQELQELLEHESQRLVGQSAEGAFAMLDRGELHGSVAADELGMLRSLLAST